MFQILRRIKRIVEAEKNFDRQEINYDSSEEELKRIIEELNKETNYSEEAGENSYRESADKRTHEDDKMNPERAFRILQISGDASNDEIRAAYLKRIKEYHPDKMHHLGIELQELATRKTVEINKAYEYLKSIRNIK